jgi:polysaccharide export outer membrane protein
MFKKIIFSYTVIIALVTLTGCPRQINEKLSRTLESDTIDSLTILALDPIIQKNDILYINISVSGSENAQKLAMLMNGINQNSSASSNLATMGYLVDPYGKITLPQLGVVDVAGKRKQDVVTELYALVKKQFILNPIINLRIINYRVFIEGEVGKPGAYEVPNELLTLPQAISMAGGFTVYSQKNDVRLIRDDNGKKKLVHLDLTAGDLLDKDKEYYYLKQNDQIIVNYNKERLLSANQSTARTISYATGAITLLLTIFTLFR